MLGRSSRVGSSEKHTARTPRAALRWISFAASSDVPERDDAERDVDADRGVAPLLDHPVVVGLDARERELHVVGLLEGLAAEPRERRERQRPVDPVELEVLLALLGVPAAGAHVVVGDRGHRHDRLVERRHVVAVRRRLRDRDELLLHVDDLVLVDPGVAPLAFGILGHLVLGALLEPERAPALALDARPLLPVLLGQPGLPDVRGLDDVVVDADDLRQLHGTPGAARQMTCVSVLKVLPGATISGSEGTSPRSVPRSRLCGYSLNFVPGLDVRLSDLRTRLNRAHEAAQRLTLLGDLRGRAGRAAPRSP